jgi:anaerobic C4-dicarboxylate transporter
LVDIQTVSIAIASASVVAGVVYYALQLRHQGKMRQTDLVIRLASDMRSIEVVGAFVDVLGAEFKDYDDFVKKYGAPFS